MKKFGVCITMAYNDWDNLKYWIAHYARLAPSTDLLIFDHGSSPSVEETIGTRDGLKIVRLEREAHHSQVWRAEFISGRASLLAELYSNVIYTDCDELLVPDPDRYSSLDDFMKSDLSETSTAIGFDVIHDVDAEPELTEGEKASEHRKCLQLVGAMCKTVRYRETSDIRWEQGFHCCNRKPNFGDLYLFHLRYADNSWARRKLAATRQIVRPDPKPEGTIDHWKISDEQLSDWMRNWLRRPRVESSLSRLDPAIRGHLEEYLSTLALESSGIWSANYSLRSNEIYTLPLRFLGSF